MPQLLLNTLWSYASNEKGISLNSLEILAVSHFNIKNLQEFISIEAIKDRLIKIKEQFPDLYTENLDLINLMLNTSVDNKDF